MAITTMVSRTVEKVKNVTPYLVDVPVKTNIWIRSQCQKKQFEIIKKAKPSILFIQSDGGRNEKEWKIIQQNRKLYEENVDWDCEIHFIYSDINLGLYSMGLLVEEYIWNVVDRCIMLEDDHIPSVSFFRFCFEMLDRYKDDLRICAICGCNQVGNYESASSDYIFSRHLAIWGIAYWRRTYNQFNIKYRKDPNLVRSICNNASKSFQRQIEGYANEKLFNKHVPGWEFFLNMCVVAQHQMFIFPKRNMISCIGVTTGSAHAPDNIRKLPKGVAQLYNTETYEIAGEIKHPSYVFPNIDFEKKQERILALHHPFVRSYRRIVGIIKRLCYGEGKKMIYRYINRKTKKAIET